MLVYPDYPTSLSKLSLNKKLQKALLAMRCVKRSQTWPYLKLTSNYYRKDGESTGKHLSLKMSICNNTTVNQETTLKLQSIRKTKTCCNACKKTFNDSKLDGVPRYFTKKYCGTDTWYQLPKVPLTVLKKYRSTFVHGTAHQW